MAEHRITVAQPTRDVVNNDYQFDIHSDGVKLGSLGVSKGSVDWWPRNAKLSVNISWEDFVHLLDGFGAAPNDMRKAAKDALAG